jgi:UDP-N-acetylglucosamine acyltransferase
MIHPTAIVSKNAELEKDVEIGPYAIIGDGAKLSKGTKIGAYSVVEHAEIGENCTIFSHCSIGTAPQDLKYKNEPTKLVMGINNVVREFCSLNRGTVASGVTTIGSDNLFMVYCHIAHDCLVGNGIIMANGVGIAGHAEIEDFAVMGAYSAVHQYNRIGKMAMIGGGSMVTLDILPFSQAQGDRARLVGLNLVGLKRRGITRESIEEIRMAYRTLFMSGLQMEDALDQLEAASPCIEVRDMIEFIHKSKRGIARSGRKDEPEE